MKKKKIVSGKKKTLLKKKAAPKKKITVAHKDLRAKRKTVVEKKKKQPAKKKTVSVKKKNPSAAKKKPSQVKKKNNPLKRKITPLKKKVSIPKNKKAPLKDIKGDIVSGVTKLATSGINKAIASQLGDTGKAILGPVVEKGIGAIIGALGLTPAKGPTDTEKIMAELAKIKDTLNQMKAELEKIQSGIAMLAGLVVQETERINQAAKYRDYMDARDSIESKWIIIWSIITSIAKNPDNKDKVEAAIDLYKFQTAGFGAEILKDMKKMQNAVLKMFDDKESLFDRMSRLSIEMGQKEIMNGVSKYYTVDLMSLTKRMEPEIWKKLEEGPCGKAIKEPAKYPGMFGILTNNWYGDSWFLFMKNARPVLEATIQKSPLTVFLAEINMMASKALLMLSVIYRDQYGLIFPANAVVDVVNTIRDNANSNHKKYAASMLSWVTDCGSWGDAPIKTNPSMPDRSKLFGLWAVFWMNVSTKRLMMAPTYVADKGQYYPCSIVYNSANIKTVAEKTWKGDPTPNMMMAYFVNDKNKLDQKTFFQPMGKNIPTWFKDFLAPKENPIDKMDKLEDTSLKRAAKKKVLKKRK